MSLVEVSPPPSPSGDAPYAVGTAPEEFYSFTLPPWRAAARRFFIRRLHLESESIAGVQERLRSPCLDIFFVYTSSLGTHTFFMMALPALFFFGFADIGRGLVFVLAMGVYVSSFIKDLICAPRPYAPPVTRLTIGSHHLEYGFPSTHSTNSVSIALFMYSHIHVHYFAPTSSISTPTYIFSCTFLSVYVSAIVLGRLYTGMHSIVDCAAGVALGIFVWVAHTLLWGRIEGWLVRAHWTSPLLVVMLCGLIVHWHPQPADDCPCFEDAIAFVSVVSGELVSRWMSSVLGFEDENMISKMPGSPWAFLSAFSLAPSASVSSAWRPSLLWWSTALFKLTLGIAFVFIWRLVAKFLLHTFLPPLFRLVSIKILPKGVLLPHRRFYIPATEYAGGVPEPGGGLHPIPSVIDLPSMVHEEGGRTNRREKYQTDGELGGMKRRVGKAKGRNYNEILASNGGLERNRNGFETSFGVPEQVDDDGDDVKHYDADVLTKVIVYAGIGFLSTGPIPILFETFGPGLHP